MTKKHKIKNIFKTKIVVPFLLKTTQSLPWQGSCEIKSQIK